MAVNYIHTAIQKCLRISTSSQQLDTPTPLNLKHCLEAELGLRGVGDSCTPMSDHWVGQS